MIDSSLAFKSNIHCMNRVSIFKSSSLSKLLIISLFTLSFTFTVNIALPLLIEIAREAVLLNNKTITDSGSLNFNLMLCAPSTVI